MVSRSRRRRMTFHARWTPVIDDDHIVSYLNQYFKDFKNNVEYNRFDKIDTKIQHLIINKFEELFDIWNSNSSASRYLEISLFENVYNAMSKSNAFKPKSTIDSKDINDISISMECSDMDISKSTESIDLNDGSNSADENYLECDECGEEIILRNNNREYSIAHHKSSLQHVECVGNLARIRNQTISNPSVIRWELMWQNISKSNRLECVLARFKESPQHLSLVCSNEKFIEVHVSEEEFIRCTLCCDIFHLDSLLDHFKDDLHENRKLLASSEMVTELEDVNGVRINYLTSKVDHSVEYMTCHLCMITTRIDIPAHENEKSVEQNSHLQNIDHLLNLHALNVNKSYFEVTAKRRQVVRCKICEEDFQLQWLTLHLYSFSHYKRKILHDVNLIDLQKEVDEMDIDLIDQFVSDNATYVKCSLCKVVFQTTSFENDVDSHKRDDEHQLNMMTVHANRYFIRMFNKTVKLIGCTICDEVFHVDSLMYHLNTEKHQKSRLQYLH